MKKWTSAIILLFTMLILSNCSTLTEEYRFKKRFDKFHEFLSKEEKSLFIAKDFKQLGTVLDNRIAEKELQKEWSAIKDGEAISTFSSSQCADFFYTILLREINRENFRQFMSQLSAEEQLLFCLGKDYQTTLTEKLAKDKKFKKFIDQSKSEFRLYGFNDTQVLDFFFEISYPEVSGKQFYYFCDAMKRAGVIQEFVDKDFKNAAEGIEKYSASHPFYKKYLNTIRENAAMKMLSYSQLISVFYEVGFKQMDKEAAKKTISKFITMGSN